MSIDERIREEAIFRANKLSEKYGIALTSSGYRYLVEELISSMKWRGPLINELESKKVGEMSRKLPHLNKGDKIKLYGRVTTVTGFGVQWNDALDKYEIILWTTGRGDPFERSLDVIEVLNKNH